MLDMQITVSYNTRKNNKVSKYKRHYLFPESQMDKFYKTLEKYQLRMDYTSIRHDYLDIVSISRYTKVVTSCWKILGFEDNSEMLRNIEVEVFIWQDER